MRVFVIGSLNMDLVIKTDKYPTLGETVTGSSFMTNPGGKGANQAVACQRFLCDTFMVGAVGETFGNSLLDTLKFHQVHTDFIEMYQDISSGVALITVAESDNAIVLDMGANQRVNQNLVDRALQNSKENDLVLLQNEIPIDTVSYALKKAKSLNLTTFYNPAPAKKFNIQDFQFVDYLILNQTETKFYTQIYPHSIDDAKVACQKLKNLGVSNIILTMGEKGSFYQGEKSFEVSANEVDVIDTTAAGDTFIGGIVSGFIQALPIEYTLKFASAAAALTITKEGAQQSIPTYEEVIQFMSGKNI